MSLPSFADDLELHRAGIGLLPRPGEDDPGTAIHFLDPRSGEPTRSCTCRASRERTCPHLLALGRQLRALGPPWPEGWDAATRAHPWTRLFQAVAATRPVALAEARRASTTAEDEWEVLLDAAGAPCVWLHLGAPGADRLRQRLTAEAPRSRLLDRLALFQLDDGERRLAEIGMKTRRQTWEESAWYRLAVSMFRDHPVADIEVEAGLLLRRGGPVVMFRREGEPILALSPGRAGARRVFELLRSSPEWKARVPESLPLPSLFHADESTALESGDRAEADREALQVLQKEGEARLLAHPATESRRWGDQVVVPGLDVLTDVEPAGSGRRFKAPHLLRLAQARVPGLDLPAPRTDDGAGTAETESVRVLDRLFSILVRARRTSPGLWSLRADYAFGAAQVSLRRALAARRDREPFLETDSGWIDLGIEPLRHLDRWVDFPEDEDGVHVGADEILRLRGEAGVPIEVEGDDGSGDLEGLLAVRGDDVWVPPAGLHSSLREYQALGVRWLDFLWSHRLSGLLCDDMGLGKTHQTMAWMLGIRERGESEGPFLVVAPTSVLPHWRDKIRQHAPSLRARIHHGPDRHLKRALDDGIGVLLTSYGVLRNDAEPLARVRFTGVVFDEVQFLKNRGTVSHRAARGLDSAVRIGLTGTPIENSLADLKSLFDLVLPGYLGTDRSFETRYLESGGEPRRIEELRRMTGPFLLRRTKQAVLEELPSKIEDVRTCSLSADQLDLYRAAVRERGLPLAQRIAGGGDRDIPFLHVFALLSHLKRICDHPALALDRLDRAEEWESGKWDLYREILRESLESGQKVVVFTQYLGMIELMERNLTDAGVGHTVLIGSTRDRGARVDRFNRDPDCRVFLGSLKAGGTGIDLVGGSVVIHYDRWWNAAREDQATDRVHRIGQTRGVHVLKLVTADTLEERIHDIISRKRALAEDVVQADDPRLAKLFTRDQLLDLLRDPLGEIPGLDSTDDQLPGVDQSGSA